MWTRYELKTNAKTIFKKNYWKFVLLGLIFALFSGALSDIYDLDKTFIDNVRKGTITDAFKVEKGENLSFKGVMKKIVKQSDLPEKQQQQIFDALDSENGDGIDDFVGKVIVSILLIVLFAFIIMVLFDALIIAPIKYGIMKAFLKSSKDDDVCFNEIGAGFKDGYGKVVLTLFLRDLFIALWSLLLIVPGIIKFYEYRMVEYALANNPNMTRKEAFAYSKEMMRGNKWKTFVLDLSFIGWAILGSLTFGIITFLWLIPYVQLTNCQLFYKLYDLTYKTSDIDTNNIEENDIGIDE